MTEAFNRGFKDELNRLVKSASGLLGYLGDIDGPKEGYRAGAKVLRLRSGAPSANPGNPWITGQGNNDTSAFGKPGSMDVQVPAQPWQPPSNTGMPNVQQKFTSAPINSTIGARTTINTQQPAQRTGRAPNMQSDVRVSVRRKSPQAVGPSGTVLASNKPLPNGFVYNNAAARARVNL